MTLVYRKTGRFCKMGQGGIKPLDSVGVGVGLSGEGTLVSPAVALEGTIRLFAVAFRPL